MAKDYSLEDYSTPAALAQLNEKERDAVRRFIHQGVDSDIVDRLVQSNEQVRQYIDEQTDKKL